jgi:hypothetical protein
VHADRRQDFALEADTHPVVNRVEQAAYDVLFNKQDWRSDSTTRRDAFHPWLAAADQAGDTTILYKGGDIHIEMQPLDGFGAYPYFMFNLSPALPTGWVGAGSGLAGDTRPVAGSSISVRDGSMDSIVPPDLQSSSAT